LNGEGRFSRSTMIFQFFPIIQDESKKQVRSRRATIKYLAPSRIKRRRDAKTFNLSEHDAHIIIALAIMRISEQIDALETMDINPIRFIISPKLAASLISFPLLTAFFDVVGIIGGYLSGCVMLGLNKGIYFYRVESFVVMEDVTGGFVKALVFGAVVTVICCFQGYYTHRKPDGFGARGVGQSTTTAVVHSCVVILLVDYVITSILL